MMMHVAIAARHGARQGGRRVLVPIATTSSPTSVLRRVIAVPYSRSSQRCVLSAGSTVIRDNASSNCDITTSTTTTTASSSSSSFRQFKSPHIRFGDNSIINEGGIGPLHLSGVITVVTPAIALYYLLNDDSSFSPDKSWWNLLSNSVAKCEAALLTSPPSPFATESLSTPAAATEKSIHNAIHHDDDETITPRKRWRTIRRKAKHVLRLFARTVQLFLALSPAVALYPVHSMLRSIRGDDKDEDEHQEEGNGRSGGGGATTVNPFDPQNLNGDNSSSGWYFRLCLRCAEWSGAAVIKLMQWASSRPDLFGHDFCDVFMRLQDDTTPHAWSHTERVLRDSYGDNWREHIRVGKLIGSGCIGQVYKGVVEDENGIEQRVAVKVMHPNVRDNIDVDLDLMRFMASVVEHLPFNIGAQIRWLNLPGAVEEFATLLKLQLDLRKEASNLERFNKNFAKDENVVFPKLIKGFEAHPDILIETYCDGIPVAAFVKAHEQDKELLTKLCKIGVRTVCKMIFDHNFVHGDLHPGNVFISPDARKFILLDAGMVTEYTDEDHDLIVSVLTSFIRKNGRRAGELLVADSNLRMIDENEAAINEEAYIDKIEALTIRANDRDYIMQHLGTYITYICDAAAKHHVMMNESFVSAALAVKVQEGIALALDPEVQIWQIANPIIIETEFRRKLAQLRKRFFRIPSLFSQSTDPEIASLLTLQAAL